MFSSKPGMSSFCTAFPEAYPVGLGFLCKGNDWHPWKGNVNPILLNSGKSNPGKTEQPDTQVIRSIRQGREAQARCPQTGQGDCLGTFRLHFKYQLFEWQGIVCFCIFTTRLTQTNFLFWFIQQILPPMQALQNSSIHQQACILD